MTFQRTNENIVRWHAPFHNLAFDNISQHFKKFGEKLVANVSMNIWTLAVSGRCNVKTQIPILQATLDHWNIPLAAIKKDKGVDVPRKEIRSLNVVRLVEGILHQRRVVRTAPFGCSGKFHFPGKNWRLAAFAKD